MSECIKPCNRCNTASIKWDFLELYFGKEDLLPFWIADSDYQTAPAVIEALKKRCENGAFGYTGVDREYREIVCAWVKRRYGYEITAEMIIPTGCLVSALFFIIECLTESNEAVLVQPPVYNPFYNIIRNNRRQEIRNPLKREQGYVMDYDDLAKKLNSNVGAMILCNPHNPVGRVWTEEELRRVVNICKEHNVILISDEIHCDIVLDQRPFVSAGKFFDEYDNIIVCTAPSKTFNIAGLQTSNVFIASPLLRDKVQRHFLARSQALPNLFGLTAVKAAYRYCDEWLETQLRHIAANRDYFYEYFKEHIPEAHVARLEGTYLMWVDMRFLDMTCEEIKTGLREYGVAVNQGVVYGEEYEGYIRINIACTLEQLKAGLERIKQFVREKKIR